MRTTSKCEVKRRSRQQNYSKIVLNVEERSEEKSQKNIYISHDSETNILIRVRRV